MVTTAPRTDVTQEAAAAIAEAESIIREARTATTTTATVAARPVDLNTSNVEIVDQLAWA